MAVQPTDAQLTPRMAELMLIGYLVISFAVAAVLLLRRDV
jgi:hypothetical protein